MNSEIDLIFGLVATRLPQAGIACLLVGGHAVNHYGVLRATEDVDFMVAADDVDALTRILSEEGFSNRARHESVIFFNRPGSPVRLDLLVVTRATLAQLLGRAVEVEVMPGVSIQLPALEDLLAMKVFALAQGGKRRAFKDLPDLVRLSAVNGVDPEKVLRPLCDRYGSDEIFQRISDGMQGGADA